MAWTDIFLKPIEQRIERFVENRAEKATEKAAEREAERLAAETARLNQQAEKLEALKRTRAEHEAAKARNSQAKDPNAPHPDPASSQAGPEAGTQQGTHTPPPGASADANAGERPGSQPGVNSGKFQKPKPPKKPSVDDPNGMSKFKAEMEKYKEDLGTWNEWKDLNKGPIGKLFGWAGKNPVKASIVGATVGGVTLGAVENASNIAIGVDAIKGGWDATHGDPQGAKEAAVDAAEKYGVKKFFSMMGLPDWLAGILAFVFGPLIDGFLDKKVAGDQSPAAAATSAAAAPAATTAHTGPALLNLDQQGTQDIQNLQTTMRANAANSGYTGPSDGQLTPDTVMGMQRTLQKAGQYNGPIDGQLSAAFGTALNNDHNIANTLGLSYDSYSAIYAAANPLTAAQTTAQQPAAAPAQQPLQVDPNTGKGQVQMAQAILEDTLNPKTGQPYYSGPLNGQIDAKTQAAVAAFQQANASALKDGLGNLGSATGDALLATFQKESNPPPGTNLENSILDLAARESVQGPQAARPSTQNLSQGGSPLSPGVAAAATAAAARIVPPVANTNMPPVVPPVSHKASTSMVPANTNTPPHSDQSPAPVPAAPQKVGNGWFDNALDWANGGLAVASVIPVVNEFAAVGQGVLAGARFVGDMAEGRGWKASALAAGADGTLALADAIPVVGGEASLALKATMIATKEGRVVDAAGHALSIAKAIQPMGVVKKLGVIGVGTGEGVGADLYSPDISGGQNVTAPPKVQNTPALPVAANDHGSLGKTA